MALLDTLKFTNVAKGTSGTKANPLHKARFKFINGVEVQTRSVEAAIAGEEFKPTAKRYVEKGGKRVAEELPKRHRNWWFQQGGRFYTNLFYGTTPLKIGEHNAVDCGAELEDVVKVYGVLTEATQAGELDDVLAKASVRRTRKGGDEDKQQTAPRARRR